MNTYVVGSNVDGKSHNEYLNIMLKYHVALVFYKGKIKNSFDKIQQGDLVIIAHGNNKNKKCFYAGYAKHNNQGAFVVDNFKLADGHIQLDNFVTLINHSIPFNEENTGGEQRRPHVVYKLNNNNLKDKAIIEQIKNIIKQESNKMKNEIYELLKSNCNLILTGAPGTGKTYLAKQIAAKMIFGEDKNIDEMNDDEKAKFEYQYKFVQFHPSYDYTDFVEGIRPVTKNDDTYGFKRKDGTFKEFCKRAVYFNSIIPYLKEYCIDIDNTIKNGQQYATYNKDDEEQSAKISNIIIKDNIISVQFTVDKDIKFTYNEFINMYINYLNIDVNDMVNDTNKITGKNFHHTDYYGFINTFHKKYKDKIFNSKLDNSKKDKYPFIFVIDEINRGDINKILGELFYAIDLGYRGEKGKVETQYQNLVESGDIFENGFYIPENVYIIGTMNDIDRSVESMDFAIRRRFAWQEVKPEDTADEILKDLEIDKNIANLNQKAVEILKNLNNCIAGKDKDENTNNALGEMYQIGASYFLKLDTYFKAAVDRNDDKEICIKDAYQKLWDNHLKGLIHEYVRGKKSVEEIFDKIKNKYFDLTGINCKENNEDTAE